MDDPNKLQRLRLLRDVLETTQLLCDFARKKKKLGPPHTAKNPVQVAK